MSIVQQLIDCGVMEVLLTGGEPLVRKDFMEIIDALLACDIHPEFNMSYDGVDGWHDWLRGIPNAGKIVEEAFMRCKRKGFPTGAEMCIHQGNKHLLRETVKRLVELGCESLKTTSISNVGAWPDAGLRHWKEILPPIFSPRIRQRVCYLEADGWKRSGRP